METSRADPSIRTTVVCNSVGKLHKVDNSDTDAT